MFNYTEDKILNIAKLVHYVNRSYCIAIGDNSQKPWVNAPQWKKDSIILGVKAHLKRNLSSKESHELWFKHKIANGWTYGSVKNVDLKTHPCLVEYAELPHAQRIKDYLFKGVIDYYKGQ